MDFEEYSARMTLISQRMEQISQLTAQMAIAGSADPSNPAFVSLMHNQDNLIKAADKLISAMQDQLLKQGSI
jgi:hypothetical protein